VRWTPDRKVGGLTPSRCHRVADLHGRIFATFVVRAACVRQKTGGQRSYTTRHSNILILFSVVCECRKDVVGLIYTTRFVL